jgi:hypothetical protein
MDEEFMLARIGEHHPVHMHVRERSCDVFQRARQAASPCQRTELHREG